MNKSISIIDLFVEYLLLQQPTKPIRFSRVCVIFGWVFCLLFAPHIEIDAIKFIYMRLSVRNEKKNCMILFSFILLAKFMVSCYKMKRTLELKE